MQSLEYKRNKITMTALHRDNNTEIEAVNLLWEIKNLVEQLHTDDFGFVHFDSMLSDINYRYFILFKAYKLHNNMLTDLLKKLSRIPNFENLVLRHQ